MGQSNSNSGRQRSQQKNQWNYSKFDQLDGEHPFKKAIPEACVESKVRTRKGGKVSVFNFELAKEMGLISRDHPHEMTPELEEKILETFSLVIINEYDMLNNVSFADSEIRPNTYMATRYLQLQHPNKQGKTSGDGRSVWNGQIRHNKKRWDISSCGTGATRLSPATHLQKRYFKTGDPSISYGCGYSEIEEGLATLFFSEVLHRNGIDTERVLGIIEFSKGISINIRAHPNLLRPSHFFWALKQNNREVLEELFHFYIERKREADKSWSECPKDYDKQLDFFLERQVEIFAKMAAQFESDYIFCWLDWDGDNILMDGGVIDYGSVRQFGLFHHEYRFDDVERFSTNIKEQKQKAKYIVQTFCQMVNFLKTGKRSSLSSFQRAKELKVFENIFTQTKETLLLEKIGLDEVDRSFLLESHPRIVRSFMSAFQYFERAKSLKGLEEVGDGINWSAVFCMRDILRELPQLLLMRGQDKIENLEFISIIRSTYATDEDVELGPYRKKKIREYQKHYWRLISACAKNKGISIEEKLLALTMRSSIINRYDRVTGDSITTIVYKLMAHRPKIKVEEYARVLSEFVEYQNLDPDYKLTKKSNSSNSDKNKKKSKLSKQMFEIVKDFREGL